MFLHGFLYIMVCALGGKGFLMVVNGQGRSGREGQALKVWQEHGATYILKRPVRLK